MILYLRNSNNETVVDIELFEKEDFVELRSVVCIKPYSQLLLEFVNTKDINKLISDFDELSELRGWLWEVYFMGRNNTCKEFAKVLEEVRTMLEAVAYEYHLTLVED